MEKLWYEVQAVTAPFFEEGAKGCVDVATSQEGKGGPG